ncbi:hypothetical protein LCGC14_0347340 [marine sediment metagenome]|uniref:Uncharacterized protein n=1 Tax=marine sediment metagenome TaxID=412755 RepID=A0A0F9TUN0_9ZZZZ
MNKMQVLSLSLGVLLIIAIIVVTVVGKETFLAPPTRPEWSITQSDASGLCYEVYRGRVLDSQVPCP